LELAKETYKDNFVHCKWGPLLKDAKGTLASLVNNVMNALGEGTHWHMV